MATSGAGSQLSVAASAVSAAAAQVEDHKAHAMVVEFNAQVALFRDLLIHVGQPKDCPDLRERIRKQRRTCVETCRHTSQLLLPAVRSAVAEGIPADNPHLVLLFFITQLLLRELDKCRRLVQVVPMDMSSLYENRPGPSNLGNVISQLLLCKTITPDFNQEELCSIAKDSQDVLKLLQDMQEYLPKLEAGTERSSALQQAADGRGSAGTSRAADQWTLKAPPGSAGLYSKVGSLCCLCSRPHYL
ncbi:uncharacterized protein LOC126484358 [Schistocerca serialis cubense]|uniref:uncharacterized protein LOC126484358 n=1 Tax=Schistocerca serialis cubense TaxID=2023355 RepID=UPI00214DF53F|nr:uncharacterized protein LOC126484358 [Schistocerca serialis cubense]